MSSIVEGLINAAVTGVIVGPIIAYTTYFLTKRTVKNIKNELKTEVEAWLNSEKGQKALYLIGGLLASGMKSGLGIQKGSGKLSLEGLVAQIVGSFIQSRLPQPSGETSQIQPSSGEKFKPTY